MKRGTHTNRGGNPQNNLAQLCPFFDLEFLLKNVKHALYISKRNCSRVLAACGAPVLMLETGPKFCSVQAHSSSLSFSHCNVAYLEFSCHFFKRACMKVQLEL